MKTQVKFHDRRAIPLRDLQVGQIAVGVGRRGERSVFTRVYVRKSKEESCFKAFIELTNLSDQ